ncbi:hypothetical protein WAI453_005141 [Rhynchosporium graminicola]
MGAWIDSTKAVVEAPPCDRAMILFQLLRRSLGRTKQYVQRYTAWSRRILVQVRRRYIQAINTNTQYSLLLNNRQHRQPVQNSFFSCKLHIDVQFYQTSQS